MTRIAIDDLEAPDRTIEEILAEPTIVPKRVGFCSNQVARDQWCGRAIYDDDLEWFETGMRKRICGHCVEHLLTIPVPTARVVEQSTVERRARRVRNFRRRPSKTERML